MVTRVGRRGWLLVGTLLALVGCAQIFGLNEYGPEGEDAGADASGTTTSTPEASSDGTLPNEASTDGTPPNQVPTDAMQADHPDAARVTDAGVDGPYFAPDACAGANTCAPIAPVGGGWVGPVEFWTGSGTAPPCAGYYLPFFDGGTGLSAGGAQCSCSCDAPTGAMCGSVSVQFGTGGCTTGCGSVSLAPGVCTSVQMTLSACGMGVGATLSGSTASSGSCRPTASVVLPAVQWTTQAVACEPSDKSPNGCPAGEQCVPTPTAPFQSFCIVKAGNNTCPSPFTSSHLVYSDVADGRGCSPCTCGPPTGVDCNTGAHVPTWGNTGCTANPGPDLAPLPASCTSISSIHSMRVDTAPDGGVCAPDGGTPMGLASSQNLTTVCCTP